MRDMDCYRVGQVSDGCGHQDAVGTIKEAQRTDPAHDGGRKASDTWQGQCPMALHKRSGGESR